MTETNLLKIANESKRFEEMKEYFSCDFENGLIYRKKILGNNRKSSIGDLVGFLHSTGYVIFEFKNKKCKCHRFLFYCYYGYISTIIDHKNGIKHDNCISNLRTGTQKQNCQNRKTSIKKRSSKLIGATWNKCCQSWAAQISVTNSGIRKNIHIGLFSTEKEAHSAYLIKKRELHDFCTI